MEYYGNNDWRDYHLSHHGILGMHWGKRNGPPYPLGPSDHSASEKKAGWRKSLGGGRNAELKAKKTNNLQKEQMKRVKRLMKDYTDSDDYMYSKSTRNVRNDLREMLQREDITSAKRDWEESNKEFNEFIDNDKVREKYATYAALVTAKIYPKSWPDPSDKARLVQAYKYDDLDQGTGNSFSLYLLDKGASMHDYSVRNYKAEQAYREVVEKAASDYLGPYSDAVVKRYKSGYELTTKKLIAEAMMGLDDARGDYEGYMPREDVSWYKKALKEAKKEYKDYADVDFNSDPDEWDKRHGVS